MNSVDSVPWTLKMAQELLRGSQPHDGSGFVFLFVRLVQEGGHVLIDRRVTATKRKTLIEFFTPL